VFERIAQQLNKVDENTSKQVMNVYLDQVRKYTDSEADTYKKAVQYFNALYTCSFQALAVRFVMLYSMEQHDDAKRIQIYKTLLQLVEGEIYNRLYTHTHDIMFYRLWDFYDRFHYSEDTVIFHQAFICKHMYNQQEKTIDQTRRANNDQERRARQVAMKTQYRRKY